MKHARKRLFSVIAIIFTILITFSTLFVTQTFPPVYATEEETLKFDETNVLEDLQGMEIDGKPFSLDEYGFSEFKDTKILAFVEYCYSLKKETNGNYGLYIYVYNPKKFNYVAESPLNSITLGLWDNEKLVVKEYLKFSLEFLNCSMQADCMGLFYKYKIKMPDIVKDTFYKSLNASERQYRVGELELLIDGNTNATPYNVATTYTYTGFAKGYGLNPNAESTLSFTQENCETVALDVQSTYYRLNGFNDTSRFTQDTLYSVYFAVPNSLLDKYGNLSAVHARWLKSILKPGLIVGDLEVYNELNDYIGKSVEEYSDEIEYMLLGDYQYFPGVMQTPDAYWYGYAYNLFPDVVSANAGCYTLQVSYGSILESLYLLEDSGFLTDSADSFILRSDAVLKKIKEVSAFIGGELVNNKYSKVLFESIDDDWTDKTIKADNKFSLTGSTISYDSWWKKLFNYETITKHDLNDIQAIYSVTAEDISLSKSELCNKLFIAETDYDDFIDFYDKNKEDATVFLFRFDVSDYTAQEATIFTRNLNTSGRVTSWKKISTNAYFVQTSMYLDFDIIDLTFSNGELDTVIPVVASPLDIVSDFTPPLKTTSDEVPKWVIILIIILVIVIVIIIIILLDRIGLLPAVTKGVIWLIGLPVRLIKMGVQAVKEKKAKNPKGKNKVKKRSQKKKKPKQKKKGG